MRRSFAKMMQREMLDYVVYQRLKAQGCAPQPRIGEDNRALPELIEELADAYGYINGIAPEVFGELPEAVQDRICYAVDKLDEALESLGVRINNYEIKG